MSGKEFKGFRLSKLSKVDIIVLTIIILFFIKYLWNTNDYMNNYYFTDFTKEETETYLDLFNIQYSQQLNIECIRFAKEDSLNIYIYTSLKPEEFIELLDYSFYDKDKVMSIINNPVINLHSCTPNSDELGYRVIYKYDEENHIGKIRLSDYEISKKYTTYNLILSEKKDSFIKKVKVIVKGFKYKQVTENW